MRNEGSRRLCATSATSHPADEWRSELNVVQRAIDATRPNITHSALGDGAANREQEPDYYLIANGPREFQKQIGFRLPTRNWLVRAGIRAGIRGYVAGIAVILAISWRCSGNGSFVRTTVRPSREAA